MKRGIIYGKEVEMAGSPLTLLYFREQFDESLPAFLQKAYTEALDPEYFLRVAWAMAKTVHPYDVAEYEDWLCEFPDEAFSLGEETGEFLAVMLPLIDSELFCKRQTLPRRLVGFVKQIWQRFRGWIAGR